MWKPNPPGCNTIKMSFRKNWDADRIIGELASCTSQVRDARNDGWSAWGCKQDLYRVKFALDEMLKHAPTFAGESEWLLDQERLQIWKILKNE
jgi:hypothetical protein